MYVGKKIIIMCYSLDEINTKINECNNNILKYWYTDTSIFKKDLEHWNNLLPEAKKYGKCFVLNNKILPYEIIKTYYKYLKIQ